MMEHTGIVEKIEAGRITVAVALDGCATCGHGSSCGMAALSRRQSAARMDFPAPSGVCAGDVVTLTLPTHQGGLFPLLGYFLPALALVIGAALGSSGGSDGSTALGALCGFALAMLLIRFFNTRLPTPALVVATPSLSSISKGVSP